MICPNCHKKAHEYDFKKHGKVGVRLQLVCINCGITWYAEYKLVNKTNPTKFE